MNKDLLQRLRRILRGLLSGLLLIAGACLMAACLGIYHSGDQPFSRESVAAAFSGIAFPVYLCLGVLALTVLLELLLPSPSGKPGSQRQTAMILQRMQERTDLSLCPEALRSNVLALRSSRQKRTRTNWIILILCSAVFLSYGMNPHNFHQSQINGSMIRAMYLFVPCCLIPFGFGIFAARRNRDSMESEIALLKTAPKESKLTTAAPPDRRLTAVRNLLLVAAIGILVYGFFTGGTADVLTKAVNICTECVGLG